MAHREYLLTLAEVAAAFVGFSTGVGAIRPHAKNAEVLRVSMHDVAVIALLSSGACLWLRASLSVEPKRLA